MSGTEDNKQENSIENAQAMELETRLEAVTKDTSNGDVQKKELEEEIKKEVERRYQKEITRELGSNDAREVLSALIKVQGNYQFVGLYWKVPGYEIQSIQGANMFQPRPCLLAIIGYWLNHNTKKIKDALPINFQSVIGAIRDPTVGSEAAASDVERELREKIEKEVRKEKDPPDESIIV